MRRGRVARCQRWHYAGGARGEAQPACAHALVDHALRDAEPRIVVVALGHRIQWIRLHEEVAGAARQVQPPSATLGGAHTLQRDAAISIPRRDAGSVVGQIKVQGGWARLGRLADGDDAVVGDLKRPVAHADGDGGDERRARRDGIVGAGQKCLDDDLAPARRDREARVLVHPCAVEVVMVAEKRGVVRVACPFANVRGPCGRSVVVAGARGAAAAARRA